MADKPNDRPKASQTSLPASEPRLFLVIDGKRFPRPGLETVFIDTPVDKTLMASGCACKPVASPICACIKVSRGTPICSCVGHTQTRSSSGSSRGGSSGGGSRRTTTYGCRCAPVY